MTSHSLYFFGPYHPRGGSPSVMHFFTPENFEGFRDDFARQKRLFFRGACGLRRRSSAVRKQELNGIDGRVSHSIKRFDPDQKHGRHQHLRFWVPISIGKIAFSHPKPQNFRRCAAKRDPPATGASPPPIPTFLPQSQFGAFGPIP